MLNFTTTKWDKPFYHAASGKLIPLLQQLKSPHEFPKLIGAAICEQQ
jgi:hypothetical protein